MPSVSWQTSNGCVFLNVDSENQDGGAQVLCRRIHQGSLPNNFSLRIGSPSGILYATLPWNQLPRRMTSWQTSCRMCGAASLPLHFKANTLNGVWESSISVSKRSVGARGCLWDFWASDCMVPKNTGHMRSLFGAGFDLQRRWSSSKDIRTSMATARRTTASSKVRRSCWVATCAEAIRRRANQGLG
jgi:hypothetical protein